MNNRLGSLLYIFPLTQSVNGMDAIHLPCSKRQNDLRIGRFR